jgi:hypothetical protein
LLERARWVLMPQVQPMRAVLFLESMLAFTAAVAGAWAARERRWWEAGAWFAAACWLPLQPVVTDTYEWRRVGALILIAFLCAVAARFRVAPLAGVAAMALIPLVGGVTMGEQLETPELRALSNWAAHTTPRDAVFLFPGAGHSREPGVFRAKALRAVYVDWKGGGQLNFSREFGQEWWRRWTETMQPGFNTAFLPVYAASGVDYIVLAPDDRAPDAPLYANARYAVYKIK